MRDGTRSVHGYEPLEDPYGSVVPPIYLGAVYRHIDDSDAILDDRGFEIKYGRENNPTVRALERALRALEGSYDALAFNSGMAAISTLFLAILRSGKRVLAIKEMYSTTIQLLEELAPLLGFTVTKVYPSTEAVEEALKGGRFDIVMLETITNPTLKVLDVPRLSETARDSGAMLLVDNTFATPVLLKPIKYGATVVVHSTTKYISGHNDVVGGVIATGSEEIHDLLWEWRRRLGTIQQPFDAYMTLRGLKSLVPRFERQSRSALALAEFLEGARGVEAVYYPGLKSSPYHEVARRTFERELYGGVLSFKVRGGAEAARRLLKALRVAKPAPSLGGSETLVTLPALTAASKLSEEDRRELGIDQSLVRVSVGLEDAEDLVEDFGNALSQLT